MKIAPRTAVAATALVSLCLLSGCGSDGGSASSKPAPSSSPSASTSSTDPSPSSSPSEQAVAATITIKNFAYQGPGTVAAGTKITVTNDDTEAHTVTADGSKAFDVKIPPGSSATLTAPSKAGTYKFHCTYHSDMHGTLTVG